LGAWPALADSGEQREREDVVKIFPQRFEENGLFEYYRKLPDDIAMRFAVVVDPMLATGHSAVAAITRLKEHGARDARLVCLPAAPEGIAELARAHPGVPIFTAAVDSHLNDHGYIVPGLGDAGDRMYGMK
jgi:uracil phosphoribosyltransferase